MKPISWQLHCTVPCLNCRNNGGSHRVSFRFIDEPAGKVNDRACHICTHHTRTTLIANGTVRAEYVPNIGRPLVIDQSEIEYTFRKETGRRY